MKIRIIKEARGMNEQSPVEPLVAEQTQEVMKAKIVEYLLVAPRAKYTEYMSQASPEKIKAIYEGIVRSQEIGLSHADLEIYPPSTEYIEGFAKKFYPRGYRWGHGKAVKGD